MGLALQSLLGVVLIPLAAYAMSENRSLVSGSKALATIAAGIGIQLAIALILLKIPQSRILFEAISAGVGALQAATLEGMQRVFGYLAGGPAPFEVVKPQAGFVLALQALPLILVMGALTRVLYYWGILQRVVAGFSHVFRRAFGIGGPLATVAAAKVFVGMVEAPMLVRPYLAGLGRGALFAAMTLGMATVAGTVLALYAAILEPTVPGAAGHVLAASLMNAPAALVLARLAVPEGFEGGPDAADIQLDNPPRSTIDAIAQGTQDGLKLLAAVIAMLVVMIALVHLANGLLGLVGRPFGLNLTFERLLGWIAAPVAFIIGIPWSEAATAGSFIGQKVILNELFAYIDLARLPADAITPRSRLLLTYALCGFANLGSLGIMVGGLTTLVPERRAEIVELAPKAVLVGLMATLLSAAVVGTLVWQ
ncbi:MAG: NupC/NupG family nucleoside CNT transporter [Hyphomicrobiaceae bacterium]